MKLASLVKRLVFLSPLLSTWAQQQQETTATTKKSLLSSFFDDSNDSSSSGQWQISEAYPPDKVDTWTFGVELDGWMMAHDGLRGEIQEFGESIQQLVAGSKAAAAAASYEQVEAIQNWWKGHVVHMRSHHANEDKIAKRFLEKRFVWPDFMEEDHNEIDHHLDRIDSSIAILQQSQAEDRQNNLQDLLVLWGDYGKDVDDHLREEERVAISLTRAYFAPHEVQSMTNRLGASGPRVETGAIVHYVGESKLREAMAAQNIPGFTQKVAWWLILSPRLKHYQKTMLTDLQIIRGEKSRRKDAKENILPFYNI